MPSRLAPAQAWRRLAHMQAMVVQQPDLVWAVSCMSLHDQLELTLELLSADTWHDDEPSPPEPSNNLIPFGDGALADACPHRVRTTASIEYPGATVTRRKTSQ